MTVEEKKAIIEAFCEEQSDCQSCRLSQIEAIRMGRENCYTPGSDTYPVNISRNYEFLFGKPEEDAVNHPPHYTQGGIECIDAMKAAFGADELAVYCKIAAFKYIWRCEHKNGLEDVKKAVWYLNKYIDLKGGGTDADTVREGA